MDWNVVSGMHAVPREFDFFHRGGDCLYAVSARQLCEFLNIALHVPSRILHINDHFRINNFSRQLSCCWNLELHNPCSCRHDLGEIMGSGRSWRGNKSGHLHVSLLSIGRRRWGICVRLLCRDTWAASHRRGRRRRLESWIFVNIPCQSWRLRRGRSWVFRWKQLNGSWRGWRQKCNTDSARY